MSKALAWTPPQTTATIRAPSVAIPPTARLAAPEIKLDSILYIHMTPYIADGWHHALHDLNLSHVFPLLVNDITYGSPIGNLPAMRHIFIPENLPSTLGLPHIIDDEITSELQAGRMSGPFSVSQAKMIFNGHFHMSPLSLIEKVPGSGKWRTICHLSKKDSTGESMNGWLNTDEFPTKYYSASMTADFVHTVLSLNSCHVLDFDPLPPSNCTFLTNSHDSNDMTRLA